MGSSPVGPTQITALNGCVIDASTQRIFSAHKNTLMASLKSLAKDTAIYGLSSIVGRFLNYLLTPLYTGTLKAADGGYGVITEVYSYTALFFVILTFGMETSVFRFINREDEKDPQKVYTTALMAVLAVGLVFYLSVVLAIGPISTWMGYADHHEYVLMMAAVVVLDAFQAIPYCYLRYQKRPIKFATLKMGFIFLNMGLNLLFFWLLPELFDGWEVKVGYAFAINLFCTGVMTFGFWKELTGVRWRLDWALLKRMLSYSWPILVLGIAGILNQTADKIIFKHVMPGHEGEVELGIYGACVKIAMIMAMITQAFRYAYEPFVFAAKKSGADADNREMYATAMKYFIIFTLLAFLCVVGYMDILKHLIGDDYWPALKTVPVVMVAEILMGVYFNLSFWYKLTDRTIWGAWFSGAGCVVLFAINIIFIPHYSYMACAWAGVAGYGTATLLSYFVGQHYYPIKYPLGSIATYVVLAAAIFCFMQYGVTYIEIPALRIIINTLLIALFVSDIVRRDFPLSNLPIVGKYFRK